MKEIELKIVSVNVEVGTRKINCTWTREAIEDLLPVNQRRKKRIERLLE